MNQILSCDWLSQRTKWGYISPSLRFGTACCVPHCFFFFLSYNNPILTMLFGQDGDIALIPFLRVYEP